MSAESLLIELIQSFPHLYDLRNKDFKNNEMKEDSWQIISNALEISDEECKRMWTNLRARYSREKKALLTGSGAAAVSEWEFFNHMCFMSDLIKPRKSYTNATMRPSPSKIMRIEGASQGESESSPFDALETIIVEPDAEATYNVDGDTEVEPDAVDTYNVDGDTEGLSKESTPRLKNVKKGDDIAIVEKLADGIINKKSTINTAFGQYVSMTLDSLPIKAQRTKKVKICQILEEDEGFL